MLFGVDESNENSDNASPGECLPDSSDSKENDIKYY